MGLLSPQFSKRTMSRLCARLSMLLEAGIPTVRSLALLEDTPHRSVRHTVRLLRDDIERGASLAQAVHARSRVFPPFFVAMVAAGEESGALGPVLRQLASDYEAQGAYRSTAWRAITYPLCVVVAAAYIIPVLRMVMTGANQRQLAEFLLRALSGPAVVLLCYAALSHLGLFRAIRVTPLACLWSMSYVARSFDLANTFGAMATLYASGLSLPRCLERAAAIAVNPRLRAAVLGAVPTVRSGGAFSDAFADTRIIPRSILGFVISGEQAGKLDSALEHAATGLREAADHRLRLWLISLESLLILAIGAAIIAGFGAH